MHTHPQRRSTRARRLALGLTLLAGSCQGTLTTIELERSALAEVPAATLVETLIGDLGLSEFSMLDITTAEEIQNQGAEPGDIKDVTLGAFTLSTTSPEGADLSFIDSIEVYVASEGLERRRVAHRDAFPEGQSSVELELDEVDLTDYAVSAAMTFELEAGGQRPEDATGLRADVVVLVGVTVQGACKAAQRDM
ncbi:MAG: hypothetical protein H6713_00850 [Myxococcales bacterium]|nr:hypothetical protein [Myxococcales bacterium]MCB9748531.1 hypothetical protein [Myxococcales bacterium]